MVRNLMIAACILLFASCSKDVKDELFGKWQLQEVEANGETERVDSIYFNFENSLFMYQIYRPATQSFRSSYGYITPEADDKVLLELTSYPGAVSNFLPDTDWTSAKRIYTIEKLTVKKLIMSSEGKTYVFRKF